MSVFEFSPLFFCKTDQFKDWDKTSTPLAAKGKEPKYVKPADKVSAEEGSNAFFFLDIVGDPIPTVTWFKVI